jgi:enoyl-CoA hydratase/carnithine racemase
VRLSSAETIGALGQFEAKGTRAAVLRSARNQDAWSAGHDLGELPKTDVDPLPYSDSL